jgi:hypothetical protein
MTMTMNASILDGHLLFEGQVVYDEQVSSDMLDLHTYLITDSCAHNPGTDPMDNQRLKTPISLITYTEFQDLYYTVLVSYI